MLGSNRRKHTKKEGNEKHGKKKSGVEGLGVEGRTKGKRDALAATKLTSDSERRHEQERRARQLCNEMHGGRTEGTAVTTERSGGIEKRKKRQGPGG